MKIKREIDGKEVEIELTGPEILTIYNSINSIIDILEDIYGYSPYKKMTKILAIETLKEHHKRGGGIPGYGIVEEIVDKYNLEKLPYEEYKENE